MHVVTKEVAKTEIQKEGRNLLESRFANDTYTEGGWVGDIAMNIIYMYLYIHHIYMHIIYMYILYIHIIYTWTSERERGGECRYKQIQYTQKHMQTNT